MKKSCRSPFWLSIRRFGSLHSQHISPTVACSNSLLRTHKKFEQHVSILKTPSSPLRDRMTRSQVDYPKSLTRNAFSSHWRCCTRMCSPPGSPKDNVICTTRRTLHRNSPSNELMTIYRRSNRQYQQILESHAANKETKRRVSRKQPHSPGSL